MNSHVKMPTQSLNDISMNLNYISNELDPSILNEFGLFIIKNSIPLALINKYREYYYDYKKSIAFDRNLNHLTEVNFDANNDLSNIIREDAFVKTALRLFPHGAGVYNMRIVKKDSDDNKPVFLHQDVGYQHGSFQRYSLFMPLTVCDENNGGLTFYPGTHNFGYLGDAGAINEEIVPSDLILVTPCAHPGDIIVMDSHLWHKSGANRNGTDRIYYDVHVNSNMDPANKFLVGNSIENPYSFIYDNNVVFVNSRLQRLKNYQDRFGAL
jgi:hypothetical protein